MPEQSEHREFLWKTHSYINDYIRFADTKAAFCFGVSAALLGALFSSKSPWLFLGPATESICRSWATLLAVVLLVISIISTLAAVYPRFWVHSVKGYVSYLDIAEFDSANAFAGGIAALSPEELDQRLSEHTFSLARICRRKYRCVAVSMATGLVGGTLAALVLAFGRTH